jgi:fatty-acid desaturase
MGLPSPASSSVHLKLRQMRLMSFRFVDSDNDPHSALKGLWYSHIEWIFEKRSYAKASLIDMHDLESDSGKLFVFSCVIP